MVGLPCIVSESVCQVTRNWVDVGSFHTRLFIIFMIFTASFRNILDIPSYRAFYCLLFIIGTNKYIYIYVCVCVC
jgi:hypothetical protein